MDEPSYLFFVWGCLRARCFICETRAALHDTRDEDDNMPSDEPVSKASKAKFKQYPPEPPRTWT